MLSLFNSFPGILNVLVIASFFFLLFGILGTNFFKGKFYKCYTEGIVDFELDASKIIDKLVDAFLGGISLKAIFYEL